MVRVRWRIHRFPDGPQSGSPDSRFRKPPVSSRTVGFPESGWRPWLSLAAFPSTLMLKCSLTYTPTLTVCGKTRCGLAPSPQSRLNVLVGLAPTAAMAESPFALFLRCYRSRRNVHRSLGQRYPALIATPGSCASPAASATPCSSLRVSVFAGCHEPLLPTGPSRRYLCRSVSTCLDPYPGGSRGAPTRFFPQDDGLPGLTTRSALYIIRTATSVRPIFRGCSHLMIFRPADLLATPIAPTAVPLGTRQPWLLLPRISRSVTSPSRGYASRPLSGN